MADLLFKAVLHSVGDPIVVYRPGGSVVAVNEAACRLFGCRQDELLGTDPAKLFGPAPCVCEEGAVREVAVTTKQGRTVAIELRETLVNDEGDKFIAAIVRNVHLCEGPTRLSDCQEWLQSFVEQSSEGISVVNGQGLVVVWNRRLEELSGVSKDSILGRPVWELQPDKVLIDASEVQREAFKQDILTALRTGQGPFLNKPMEVEIHHPDGSTRIVQQTIFPMRTIKGLWLGAITSDITAKKVEERAKVESEEWLRTIFSLVSSGIAIIDPQTHVVVDINPMVESLLGLPREMIIGRPCRQYFCSSPAGRCPVTDLCQKVSNVEETLHRHDGTKRPIMKTVKMVTLQGKDYLLESFMDITDLKTAQERLRESEARYRLISEHIKDVIYRINLIPDFEMDYVSTAAGPLLGYTEEEFRDLGVSILDSVHEDDRDKLDTLFSRPLSEWDFESPLVLRLIKKDGSIIWADFRSTPIVDKGGRVVAVEGVARDVTREKRAEEALHYRMRFESLIASLSTQFITLTSSEIDRGLDYALRRIGEFVAADRCHIYQTGPDGRSLGITHEWVSEGLQPQRAEFQDLPMTRFPWLTRTLMANDIVHITDTSKLSVEASLERRLLEAQGVKSTVMIPIRMGSQLTGFIGYDMSCRHRTWDPDTLSLLRICGEMITNALEKEEMEEKLSQEKERLAVTLRSIGDGVITTDIQGRVVLMNRVAEELTGWKQEEAMGQPLEAVFDILHEKTREACENPARKALRAGGVVTLASHTSLIAKDGTERSIADSGAPITDKDGNTIGVVLVFRDVTKQRIVEERLANSQKLEAVGTLAGGIAHDFNNLLTAILGNIGVVKMEADPHSRQYERLVETEKAIGRAKDLTKQLLTFSKGGAPVKQVTSLSDLLRDTAGFVLTGSNVKCIYRISPELHNVEVDQGQISQVISNLVVNAKEAMPEGGVLEISAENVILRPGEHPSLDAGAYVKLMVRDSGVGIREENLPKIFEPYFTTKRMGSGLGLSIAYSILLKHDGSIEVSSRPGMGTTFSILLPACSEAPSQESPVHEVKGTGRVLLMDDEEAILDVTSEILKHLGYEVDTSHDGLEAVEKYRRAFASGQRFDAVIMDLTIPGGMGGKEAVKKLREIDPEVKAIVSSGYSNDPVMSEFR